MKKFLAISYIAVLLGCGAKKNSNDLAINSPVKVTIDLTQVTDDKVPVFINPGRFTQDTVKYYLPKVVQGTYAVSDFGKFIEGFKAYNFEGNEVPVKKEGNNSWVITNAKQIDKFSYLVNDTFDVEAKNNGEPFSPSGTNIQSDNFVLNLHGFIGYFDVLRKNQYGLEIKSPSSMKSTSAIQKTASVDKDNIITDTYFAARYFDITDNPMFYGNLDIEEFKVDDITIVLSVYSPNGVHKASDIKETVFKMMKAQKTYLGSINSTPRYDIYLYLASGEENAPRGFGALEHHTSTVVVLPEQMPKEALDEAMIDVVSHEFFHIVTPLSVHSEDVHYFDYNAPTFSKHLWMYEGVTEYFASLFQIDQDLVTEEEFFLKIMGKINSASKFDDTMSFTKMSENILEEPYKANYINVYQKGALIGMCIDILMREESDGTRGILSLMKELSLKYGKNKPFEDDKIIEEITKMTYPSIGTFLEKHVEGTTPINYLDFFKKVGVGMVRGKIKTNYLQNAGKMIVEGSQITGTIYFNDLVANNSFWKEQGVQAKDVIKEVNGTVLSIQNANTVLGASLQWKPGDDLDMKLERSGKEVIIKTKLTETYTTDEKLGFDKGATEDQVKLRTAWLKG